MIDKILKKTGSIWFIPTLVLVVIASMLVATAIRDSMSHPKTITGHRLATKTTYVDPHGKTATSYVTDMVSNGDGDGRVWIEVVTPTGRQVSCLLSEDKAKRVGPVHDTRIRCDDTL